MRITSFISDVTNPVGSSVCSSSANFVESIRDPLFARGLVLEDGKKRFVFCTVDYCGVAGKFYEQWCKKIAKAAGTLPEFVALHAVHQHQAPWLIGEDWVEKKSKGQHLFFGVSQKEKTWINLRLKMLSQSIVESLKNFKPVASVGGAGVRTEGLASNRRILGKNNQVVGIRWSITKNSKVRMAPVGLVDPELQCVTFWDDEEKLLASMSFFAAHPQCCGNLPFASAEIPGEFHRRMNADYPHASHLYFSGCLGNVTCGKYSTSDPEKNIRLLGARLAKYGSKAIQSSIKTRQSSLSLKVKKVSFPMPLRPLKSKISSSRIVNPDPKDWEMYQDVMDKMAQERRKSLENMKLSCWRLGSFWILSLPGEPFIEYQLFAKQEIKKRGKKCFLAVAGLADYSPVYIPTSRGFSEGGYEVDKAVCFTTPQVEKVLKQSIQKVLSDS
jgi:hypothetical protein